MSVKTESVHPTTLPFDSYIASTTLQPGDGYAGQSVLVAVAMAKRILLQERVQNFTGADVVALSALILARFEA